MGSSRAPTLPYSPIPRAQIGSSRLGISRETKEFPDPRTTRDVGVSAGMDPRAFAGPSTGALLAFP